MIKPKKSARELWNQLGLRNHIKQAFQEKETTWGQIVDSNKKNQTQRSMSEYTIAQKLKEQHNSFLVNKEKQPTKTFLEDQFEKVFTEKQDWKQLAMENEKSQVSPLTKRSSNDQTFSPINRVKIEESQQYLSVQPTPKDVCKLPGHENNQYKFICIDNDCPYKLQKACAHCVIKMHTKHVSSMKEIESYEELIEQNIKRAQDLMDQSQQLFTALSKPFDEYFQLIKNHITQLIDQIQQKLQSQNKEKLQKLVQSEVELIQNMNSKFEAFKLMNTLIPDESINEYQRMLNNIKEKMKIELNLEQISRPIENYLLTLMSDKKIKDQSETTDILQQLLTTNRDSNRESLAHHNGQSIQQSPMQTKKTVQRVMGTASPLNVFNRQISSRQIPTKITYPIVYYRTNS